MAIIVGTTGDDALTGTGTADFIQGLDGNDTLDGAGGADILDGGLGNDIFFVDDSLDVITEALGEGTDVVKSTANFNLATQASNVEQLTLLDAGGNIDGTGNSLDNVITGTTGNNTLDGGGGVDTLVGGDGDDVFIVDTLTDIITENLAEGTDTILSSVNYSLSLLTHIENLTLTGSAVSGDGNTGDNIIIGNTAGNILDGSSGSDTIDGDDGDDSITGGTGIDTMTGGAGNDTFFVDDANDLIFEATGDGSDTAVSSVTFTLSATEEIEDLILSGITAIDGTGNDLSNAITGNSATNVLDGGIGNDTLDGGIGNDTLIGGVGDDTFFVDSSSDLVTEGVLEGTDTVSASADFDMSGVNGANVDNLILTGAAAIGTGNVLDNNITASNTAATDNTLDGGAGSDTMTGGDGNDTYYVDNTGDVVVENSGEGTFDEIISSVDFDLSTNGANVENLTLLGAAIVGTGDTGDNVLVG
ncbi:MAG: beta strand repeat-containing protein, partial [Alphaproteobacteria bacterium]